MARRPSFQFYPPDWRNDPGVRLCSLAARGLWIDMLCLMHEGDPYGHLASSGAPMKPEALARLVGESVATVRRLLIELQSRGVFSVSEDGLMFSRRMVRDERLREARAAGGMSGGEHGAKGAEHGAKGGRPRKDKGGFEDEARGVKKPPLGEKQKPPPSSSSSSPSSEGSEANASAHPISAGDPEALVWQMVRLLLSERAEMSSEAAGRFFGKLLSDHALAARDMLPAVSAATVNQTGDPKAYLTAAAVAVAKRRADPRLTSSQRAARSNIQ